MEIFEELLDLEKKGKLSPDDAADLQILREELGITQKALDRKESGAAAIEAGREECIIAAAEGVADPSQMQSASNELEQPAVVFTATVSEGETKDKDAQSKAGSAPYMTEQMDVKNGINSKGAAVIEAGQKNGINAKEADAQETRKKGDSHLAGEGLAEAGQKIGVNAEEAESQKVGQQEAGQKTSKLEGTDVPIAGQKTVIKVTEANLKMGEQILNETLFKDLGLVKGKPSASVGQAGAASQTLPKGSSAVPKDLPAVPSDSQAKSKDANAEPGDNITMGPNDKETESKGSNPLPQAMGVLPDLRGVLTATETRRAASEALQKAGISAPVEEVEFLTMRKTSSSDEARLDVATTEEDLKKPLVGIKVRGVVYPIQGSALEQLRAANPNLKVVLSGTRGPVVWGRTISGDVARVVFQAYMTNYVAINALRQMQNEQRKKVEEANRQKADEDARRLADAARARHEIALLRDEQLNSPAVNKCSDLGLKIHEHNKRVFNEERAIQLEHISRKWKQMKKMDQACERAIHLREKIKKEEILEDEILTDTIKENVEKSEKGQPVIERHITTAGGKEIDVSIKIAAGTHIKFRLPISSPAAEEKLEASKSHKYTHEKGARNHVADRLKM